jgi:hypothetical protein
MADNLTFSTTTKTGMPNASIIAADDISGVHYQRVKMILGANGTNDGDVASGNPMPVGGTILGATNETAPATDTAASGLNGRLQRIAQRITSLIALLPAALGQATMASSLAVVIASDQSALTANPTRPATGTTTSVADTASSTTLLASNAARLGATIFNDSTEVLYVKLGATASLTSFAVRLEANGYYEVPFGYTGIIDGIWSSNASGSARICELT